MAAEGLTEWAIVHAIRQSALEFVVEVMLANLLAAMPKPSADAFVADITSPYRAARSTQENLTEASLRAAEGRLYDDVEAIVAKAGTRADEIRGARPPLLRELKDSKA